MTPMDESERETVQRQIASILEGPFVFMGGPSRAALGKADDIIAALERAERLGHTECDHHAWVSWKQHGASCPDCWTLLGDNEK